MVSLCMILKPTKEEAQLLSRCLCYVARFVDEICITITGESKECEEVCKEYNAKVSHFKWINDFAAARNFNFKQAKGDYILWLDSDDVLKGANNLQDVVKMMEEKKIDIGVMNYLYHFNKNKTCDTKHLKTRIVKNDGCVEWVGEVHEDFKENRQIDGVFVDNMEVIHLTDDERIEESADRNYKIAKQFLKDKPSDPRSYWLMGNALIMQEKPKEAEKNFLKYVSLSNSEEEKYIAYMMLFSLTKDKKYALEAFYLRPTYPDAYINLGNSLYEQKKYLEALNFIELGLQMPIPDKEIIAYNPREYDLFPMMTMAKIYFEMGKFEKAIATVEKLAKLFPKEEAVIEMDKLIRDEMGEALEADKYLKESENIKDKEELRKYLDNLPEKVQSHPKICSFKNSLFWKTESSGKDIAYYCGYTSKYWNPDIAMTEGCGGSEEAVINLSKKLAGKGWNITVYNNCKKEGEWDGVKYRYFWKYNVRDKQDITIFWRHPKPAEYDELNSTKVFIDMHDVISDKEFTPKRLEKINKVFVKTNAHRILFPSIPDEKIAIIPNGIEPDLFDERVERNPYLIINTSSPDRHLDATLDIFEELIKKQPDKPWKLAWYYGWGVYDQVHAENSEMMGWKGKQMERFDKLVKEGRAEGGYMIDHKAIAKKYLEAGIFLYPTQFYEIHCISAVKAQLARCKIICSDFAALNETVKYGTKIHTEGKKWTADSTFGDNQTNTYTQAIIDAKEADKEEAEWAKETYNWDKIANLWSTEISSAKTESTK